MSTLFETLNGDLVQEYKRLSQGDGLGVGHHASDIRILDGPDGR